jgi:hypothetical protein
MIQKSMTVATSETTAFEIESIGLACLNAVQSPLRNCLLHGSEFKYIVECDRKQAGLI